MITVKQCKDVVEATSIKLWLESAGIPAFIPREWKGLAKTRRPSGRPTPVRLEVAQENEVEARRLLSEINSR